MRSRLVLFAKRTSLIVAATLMLVGYPATARADTTGGSQTTSAPTSTSSTTPATSSPTAPGPQAPTGADAKTYTYNPSTGLWENPYYTWNPVTGQTTPKTSQNYSYNPATGKWDTPDFKYDSSAASYVPNTPAPVTTDSAVSGTGPGSSNSTSGTNTDNQTFNNFYNATISNKTLSQAASGDATVSGNTAGGSAATGDATAVSNTFNLLQSSASFATSGGVTTFTSNVTGDFSGDLLLDPALIMSLQPASTSNGSNLPTNLTVNSQQSGQINNDINVQAASGDAKVSDNNTAGNATTGNANAVANVVNLANTTLSAAQTFVGMINIYGNLNGDILLPAQALQSLISSNGSSNSSSGTAISGNVNDTTAQAISNNVQTTAKSGDATVSDNTAAGSATTGSGSTNVTLLNLTGHQVVGADSLLVFVNVLGSWVGLIMNAPSGATAAALGGGLSTNTSSPLATDNATVNTSSSSAINNNVNVSAASGNATVSDNTSAGSATSGNATASANIINLASDQLALSNWFGILFINVFGTWHGSFGIDTPAGDQPGSGNGNGQGANGNNGNVTTTPDLGFGSGVATTSNNASLFASQTSDNATTNGANASDDASTNSNNQTVLGASTTHGSGPTPTLHASKANWQFAATGL